MKNKFLLFSFFSFLFFTANLSAQIHVGLHGSYGNAWQDYGDDFNPETRLKINSYQINASAYYSLSSNFSVGIEPGFSRRGAACEPGFIGSIGGNVVDASLFANYIQLPIMARIGFSNKKGNLELSAKLGGGVSYMTSAYREVLFWGISEIERQDVNFDQDNTVNRVDFGAQGGIGIGLLVGPGSIVLEGNYYFGMLDSSNVLTSKNRSLQIGLGYRIKL